MTGRVLPRSRVLPLSRLVSRSLLLGAAHACGPGAAAQGPATAPLAPGRFAGDGIVVGFEYALLDNPRLAAGMASAFAETGIPGMKHYVESVQWGNMQASPDAEIDFERFDRFVREYQAHGFTELTISLRPHSPWASKDVRPLTSTDASPKPEYRDLFQAWVEAVIERYDADGVDDMEGLRWPVRRVEIGNELSSYEPEPVEEYLETLRLAYEAAHRASDEVRVGHAAFLFAPVDMDVDDPAEYDVAWETTRRVDNHHDLADMRAVLDHPDRFDFINLHNLGDPYEIEDLMRWVRYETGRRGYEKPVVISDTTPTSYVGWGPANRCTGRPLGVIARPATEADRCRMAAYFTRLLDGDPAALAWTRGFVAADQVQRTVVAAEQGVRLINLAFVSDLFWLTLKPMNAGAGISAWGGAIRINPWTGRVLERYPLFHAIRQLMGHLAGYRSIERVEHPEPRARIYRVEGADGPFWIAWLDPGRVLLPDEDEPSLEATIELPPGAYAVEPVITALGQEAAEPQTLDAEPGASEAEARPGAATGRLSLRLTHTPVYILPASR